MPNDDRWVSVKEAGEFLGWSEDGMHRRIKSGVIPAWTWTRDGREYRFNIGYLREWKSEKYRALRPAKKASAA